MQLKAIIGQHFARLRAENALTQAELAHLMGISLRFYQSIETGEKYPALRTVFSLARALDLPIAEVVEPIYDAWLTLPQEEPDEGS